MLKTDPMLCDGCGTPLADGGVDWFCPNRSCNFEQLQMQVMMQQLTESRERAEYARLHAKFGPTDKQRVERMERCNWKPANVYWRERAEKAEAKLAEVQNELELAVAEADTLQVGMVNAINAAANERQRCADIVAKGWGKSVADLYHEITGGLQ